MNSETAVNIIPYNPYSEFLRAATLVTLVVFCVSAIFGFSMFLQLRQAKAFFGSIFAAIWHFLATKAWEFIKDVAKVFLLKFIQNMVVKLIQKLETLHVIKNILYYSDALGFDQYIGAGLNKLIMKPKTAAEAKELEDPKETNVASQTLDTQGLATLNPRQAEQLAYLQPAVSPEKKVTAYNFTATKTQISQGESVELSWSAEGTGIQYVDLCRDNVAQSGKSLVTPSQTTTYVLKVYDNVRAILGSKSLTITVPGTTAITCPTNTSSSGGGLTKEQESKLLRGTLAMMTSQMACGGINGSVLRNMSIYQAARARGFDPRKIDPRSGNFYTQMYQLGNPLTSPEFQSLAMQDTINSIEAQAKMAINNELNSTGMKALRAEQNQITRSGQTIADSLSQAIGSLFNTNIEGASTFAVKVGSFLADLVTSTIFQQKGRVLTENALCGVGVLAASNIYGGGIEVGQPGSFDAKITVNGQKIVYFDDPLGDTTVVIKWSVTVEDPAFSGATFKVTGLPDSCEGVSTQPVGECTDTPTQDKAYDLHMILNDDDQVISSAAVSFAISGGGGSTGGGGGGGGGGEPIVFWATPQTVSPGGSSILEWSISESNVLIKGSWTNQELPAQGKVTVTLNETTNYTIDLYDRNNLSTAKATRTITVLVQGSTQAWISPSFKVRE